MPSEYKIRLQSVATRLDQVINIADTIRAETLDEELAALADKLRYLLDSIQTTLTERLKRLPE